MPKQELETVLNGYSFRDPKGKLDCIVVMNRTDAWTGAAFASVRPYSHVLLPDDVRRARKQGFRVVPVTLRVEKPVTFRNSLRKTRAR